MCTQSCPNLDGQAEPLHPWHQGARVSKPEASPEHPTTSSGTKPKNQIGKSPLRTETCHTAKEQQTESKSSPPTNTLQAPPAQHSASPAVARVTLSKSSPGSQCLRVPGRHRSARSLPVTSALLLVLSSTEHKPFPVDVPGTALCLHLYQGHLPNRGF